MKIIEDMVDRVLTNMSPEEVQELILSVVDRMLGKMDASQRRAIMERVVDRFLDGLPDTERQATVRELVPRLLAQLMKSGNMSVDELLWSAMGSLGALETGKPTGSVNQIPDPNPNSNT